MLKNAEFYVSTTGLMPYRTCRIYRLTVHLPMWIKFQTDLGGRYPREKVHGAGHGVPFEAVEPPRNWIAIRTEDSGIYTLCPAAAAP
jgi:hypothetical protein